MKEDIFEIEGKNVLSEIASIYEKIGRQFVISVNFDGKFLKVLHTNEKFAK